MARAFATGSRTPRWTSEPSFATFTYLDHLQAILTTVARWTG
jgi:hypothetical protein